MPPAEIPSISGTSPTRARAREIDLVRVRVGRRELRLGRQPILHGPHQPGGLQASPRRPSPGGRSGSTASGTGCRRAASARSPPRPVARTGSGARRDARRAAGARAGRRLPRDRRGQGQRERRQTQPASLAAPSTDCHSVSYQACCDRREDPRRHRRRGGVRPDHDVRRLAGAHEVQPSSSLRLDVGGVVPAVEGLLQLDDPLLGSGVARTQAGDGAALVDQGPGRPGQRHGQGGDDHQQDGCAAGQMRTRQGRGAGPPVGRRGPTARPPSGSSPTSGERSADRPSRGWTRARRDVVPRVSHPWPCLEDASVRTRSAGRRPARRSAPRRRAAPRCAAAGCTSRPARIVLGHRS